MIALQCPYCHAEPVLVTGAIMYPHRPDLKDRRFWRCLPCKAWVGCHKGTDNPLGRLANAALRTARKAAHAAFDPLWVKGEMPRGKAYDWLAKALGRPERRGVHIGEMDIAECRAVIAAVKQRGTT